MIQKVYMILYMDGHGSKTEACIIIHLIHDHVKMFENKIP